MPPIAPKIVQLAPAGRRETTKHKGVDVMVAAWGLRDDGTIVALVSEAGALIRAVP